MRLPTVVSSLWIVAAIAGPAQHSTSGHTLARRQLPWWDWFQKKILNQPQPAGSPEYEMRPTPQQLSEQAVDVCFPKNNVASCDETCQMRLSSIGEDDVKRVLANKGGDAQNEREAVKVIL